MECFRSQLFTLNIGMLRCQSAKKTNLLFFDLIFILSSDNALFKIYQTCINVQSICNSAIAFLCLNLFRNKHRSQGNFIQLKYTFAYWFANTLFWHNIYGIFQASTNREFALINCIWSIIPCFDYQKKSIIFLFVLKNHNDYSTK